ncbi:hypothetical protein M8J76_005586 [Diaphorina citri]|nr:hypothetical protein M8J76_005586 [Diaphorina citri]
MRSSSSTLELNTFVNRGGQQQQQQQQYNTSPNQNVAAYNIGSSSGSLQYSTTAQSNDHLSSITQPAGMVLTTPKKQGFSINFGDNYSYPNSASYHTLQPSKSYYTNNSSIGNNNNNRSSYGQSQSAIQAYIAQASENTMVVELTSPNTIPSITPASSSGGGNGGNNTVTTEVTTTAAAAAEETSTPMNSSLLALVDDVNTDLMVEEDSKKKQEAEATTRADEKNGEDDKRQKSKRSAAAASELTTTTTRTTRSQKNTKVDSSSSSSDSDEESGKKRPRTRRSSTSSKTGGGGGGDNNSDCGSGAGNGGDGGGKRPSKKQPVKEPITEEEEEEEEEEEQEQEEEEHDAKDGAGGDDDGDGNSQKSVVTRRGGAIRGGYIKPGAKSNEPEESDESDDDDDNNDESEAAGDDGEEEDEDEQLVTNTSKPMCFDFPDPEPEHATASDFDWSYEENFFQLPQVEFKLSTIFTSKWPKYLPSLPHDFPNLTVEGASGKLACSIRNKPAILLGDFIVGLGPIVFEELLIRKRIPITEKLCQSMAHIIAYVLCTVRRPQPGAYLVVHRVFYTIACILGLPFDREEKAVKPLSPLELETIQKACVHVAEFAKMSGGKSQEIFGMWFAVLYFVSQNVDLEIGEIRFTKRSFLKPNASTFLHVAVLLAKGHTTFSVDLECKAAVFLRSGIVIYDCPRKIFDLEVKNLKKTLAASSSRPASISTSPVSTSTPISNTPVATTTSKLTDKQLSEIEKLARRDVMRAESSYRRRRHHHRHQETASCDESAMSDVSSVSRRSEKRRRYDYDDDDEDELEECRSLRKLYANRRHCSLSRPASVNSTANINGPRTGPAIRYGQTPANHEFAEPQVKRIKTIKPIVPAPTPFAAAAAATTTSSSSALDNNAGSSQTMMPPPPPSSSPTPPLLPPPSSTTHRQTQPPKDRNLITPPLRVFAENERGVFEPDILGEAKKLAIALRNPLANMNAENCQRSILLLDKYWLNQVTQAIEQPRHEKRTRPMTRLLQVAKQIITDYGQKETAGHSEVAAEFAKIVQWCSQNSDTVDEINNTIHIHEKKLANAVCHSLTNDTLDPNKLISLVREAHAAVREIISTNINLKRIANLFFGTVDIYDATFYNARLDDFRASFTFLLNLVLRQSNSPASAAEIYHNYLISRQPYRLLFLREQIIYWFDIVCRYARRTPTTTTATAAAAAAANSYGGSQTDEEEDDEEVVIIAPRVGNRGRCSPAARHESTAAAVASSYNDYDASRVVNCSSEPEY